MGRHGRRAGKNSDGRPGCPWDMALYVPVVVLMLVKRLNTRDREADVSEHVVARVCIGRQDNPSPQMREHANSARASAAVGKDGGDEIKALMLPGARDCGCADVRILGRSYEFGDRAKSNKASQRPLIQASLRCKRWLKPSSLHRIPTPLKRGWMSHLQALSPIPEPHGSPSSLCLA